MVINSHKLIWSNQHVSSVNNVLPKHTPRNRWNTANVDVKHQSINQSQNVPAIIIKFHYKLKAAIIL